MSARRPPDDLVNPRFQTLMLALQPQPQQMPPPPFDKEKLQQVFTDVTRHHSYQSFGFTPDNRGALFANGDDDIVELRPALLRVAAKMDNPDSLTADQAQEKALRIMDLASKRLKIDAYVLCAIQIIAKVDAPDGDAKEFIGKHLLQDHERAKVLGEGFYAGGVRYRDLRPQEPGPSEDNLSIEPDVNDNSLVFLDYQQARQAVTGPITLDQVKTWLGEAIDFVNVQTMALLSD
jgi:hypothetical protein